MAKVDGAPARGWAVGNEVSSPRKGKRAAAGRGLKERKFRLNRLAGGGRGGPRQVGEGRVNEVKTDGGGGVWKTTQSNEAFLLQLLKGGASVRVCRTG